jgi:hypothetical protein
MPEKKTLERARRDKAQGKSASTQAGEFVREEIEHVREGKHGARSTKQAIAMGCPRPGEPGSTSRLRAGARRRRPRGARPPATPARPRRLAPALRPRDPCDASCAVERRPERRLEGGAVTSGQRGGGETPESRALAGGPAGCRHEGASRHRPASPDGVRSGFRLFKEPGAV